MKKDKHLFRDVESDKSSPSCHMDYKRHLGINFRGYEYIKPLDIWHNLASNEGKNIRMIEENMDLTHDLNVLKDRYMKAVHRTLLECLTFDSVEDKNNFVIDTYSLFKKNIEELK